MTLEVVGLHYYFCTRMVCTDGFFSAMAAELGKNFRCLAPDLLGHGISSTLRYQSQAPALEQMLNDLKAVLKYLHIDRLKRQSCKMLGSPRWLYQRIFDSYHNEFALGCVHTFSCFDVLSLRGKGE